MEKYFINGALQRKIPGPCGTHWRSRKNPLSIDNVAAMVAGQIRQLASMEEETAELFQQLAKKMLNQTGE